MLRHKLIRKIFIFLLLFLFGCFFARSSYASSDVYLKGTVAKVLSAGVTASFGVKTYTEVLAVTMLEGKDAGKTIKMAFQTDGTFGGNEKIAAGTTIIIDAKATKAGTTYSVYEPYRLNFLWTVVALFIVLIVAVAWLKGIGALIGMSISLATIVVYIVPQIVKGTDPLTVCVIGAIFILLVTTYIAHGISLKTTVAIISTGIALALAAWLATLAVHVGNLTGLGNDDVYNIQLGSVHPINPQGLLLGSILIGTLGALNDITTTQAITIFSFAKENPTQHFWHLFIKSMHIGTEHIASLVNTLVLAYAGTSLAVFIFLALNPTQLPWWIILNNETTMEEIIRTIVGSAGLILAVPITSILATAVALYGKKFIDTLWWNIAGD